MLPEDDPMIETCRSVLNELMNILDFLYIYIYIYIYIYTGLLKMIVGVLTTCQFGTNSIIVLMFVESQRLHI